ncbi:MAG: hypothetical protein K8I29_10335 [Alphaproteobacteria bacterium]|uniref:Uncharacterized protein n=1 Tax=Candidatus Nitrobium versatile TaxID=2884831 RepID=A0A953M1U8_9BACT|nr:hypothetical protein [Candidatus Nitrobium versatile]
MANERLLHDLIVDHLKHRLSREYKEIQVNASGNPDMTLANHGLVLAFLEVETESSITPEKAEAWVEMTRSGTKLILMVAKSSKVKTMELLWQKGIADKVGVGTYEIAITMP